MAFFIALQLQPFRNEHILIGFAFADNCEFIAIDEHFRGTAAGIIVAGHGLAIGTGGEDADEITAFDGGDRPALCEEI